MERQGNSLIFKNDNKCIVAKKRKEAIKRQRDMERRIVTLEALVKDLTEKVEILLQPKSKTRTRTKKVST